MRFADESENKIVSTTRYVIDANSLITNVVYHEDGGWQFLGDEDVHDSDVCSVSVREILMIDESLLSLDLKPGQSAERIDVDSSWQTIK